MTSFTLSDVINYYSQALLVRLTSASSVNRVNFHSIQKQFNAPEWVTLIDLEDAEEHSDTEKMILLDCTKTPLLNSLATLTNDSMLVAVLCVCREVTEQELKISTEELMSGEYPPILFLQDKATDVAELKQLLLLNPQEVECSVCEEQTLSPIPLQDSARKVSSESSYNTGFEVHHGQGKSKMRESLINEVLDNILFTKEKEDDLVPLILCRHPQIIPLIVSFIHQRVDSHVHEKKENLRSSLNKIVKYLKSKVIFESHIQVDWPIYLIIFLEISQLYDSSKENLAIEALEYILVRFLKLNPDVIAYSIKRFDELIQDKVFNFRKLLSPKNELIDLFSIQYSQSQKSGNKLHYTKPIHKQQDLENKLLWYNVLMLCNQSFQIPGHSKWNEHLISHVDFEQLSIYDSSNLNTIWESGIQFGIKLGLSFQQRFLLSHIVSWVSSNARSYTFQNFNIVLDFILKSQYSAMEIADFLQYYSHFVSQYSKSDKHYLYYLIENNSKACVEMMCLTLSKLATLICTATRDSEEKSTQIEVCKKSWFDIFKLLLLYMINYFLNSVHDPRDFAVVMRCFYDIIKIPTAPEALVRPWIKEHKKEVVGLITKQFYKIDIETFHEILIKFPVSVLSKTAIFDYFTKYQPANNVSLKDQIWQDLLTIIFKIKDPPKSIFQTFEKIFTQYYRRNQGFEFICDCLEFDLPAHGLEYKPPDKEEKLISNFMRSLETKCRCELRPIIHHNLVQTLNFIPKLRFPSLLQVIIMEPLCRAVVPEQSLLSHPSKEGNCKELIISLQTISYQRNHTTFEQLKTSYEHYYLWKILASISKGIKFEKLVWSNFPYMVTTLMFVFSKYCGNIPGFRDYAWEDNNLLSFIGFCKNSINIISGHYDDILNDECSLIEYKAIQNNLKSLNELFKSCGLAILSGEEIQTKIYTFNVIAQEMKKTLILEIEVEETEIKSAFLLNFLNDHQTEVPDGIRAEIDALFNLCYEQILSKNKNGKHGLIPVLEARDTIKIKEFKIRCENLVDSFKMFAYLLFEGSVHSVHQFLAHFGIRENVLFDACLRKCMADKIRDIQRKEEGRDVHYISMEQFVECGIECYNSLHRICEGISTYAEIDQISKNLSLMSLDFSRIHTDIKMFPPLAAQIKGDLGVMNLFQLLKIFEYLSNIIEVCKQYKLDSCIASPEFDQLDIIFKRLSDSENRDKLTITDATKLLAQINDITNDMPLQRYQLFPILSDSAEFYRFLLDKNLFDNRDSFDNQVNLITSERQDEDYDDTVLTHLSIAYNYMIPLFNKLQTLREFLKYYSLMTIGSETGYSQLKTVNNNITLIRRWFILAEGETTENVSHQLQDILGTGTYEILLGNADQQQELGTMPSLPNCAPPIIKKQVASILLRYYASTKTAVMQHNKRDSLSQLPESPIRQNSQDHSILSSIEERMNTEKIDEFVRKLGFLEPTKLDEQRVTNISDFQYFHDMIRKMFEILIELTQLGHPKYQDKAISISCLKDKEMLSQILSKYEIELTGWKDSYLKIQQNVQYLLFFPIQRIITIVSLMEAKVWMRAANQLSFLFKNEFSTFPLIETQLMEIFPRIKRTLEADSSRIISPAKIMSIVIDEVTTNQDLTPRLLISGEKNRKDTRRRNTQSVIYHQTQNIHRLHGCTQSEVLVLIQKIYKMQFPIESFQLLHCNADTTFEELSLFLSRTSIFLKPVYALIEVNKLPNLLQEYTMKHIAESQREARLIASVHYIETAQSLLHELPGVKVDIHTQFEKLHFMLKSKVFSVIELVYGLEGDGKTHYIRSSIGESYYNIVISINEAFSVPAIIEKMNFIPLEIDVCIYFNFTITCHRDSVKDGKDYLEYMELMRRVNWFFFDLLVLNYVSDSSSPLIFRTPSGMNWRLYIEVPSRPDEGDPLNNLRDFQEEIPIFSIMGAPHHISGDLPYHIDKDVQLICKYLHAYSDYIDKKGVGINRLFDERKRSKVSFSAETDLEDVKCHQLLDRYMQSHVKIRKILQKLFIRYMLRRCEVLEHLPYFTFNTGTGITFDPVTEKKVMTNTKLLGSTLMKIMIFEVNKFCDPSFKEDWEMSEHQQLIYNTSGGGHTIKFLSLHPEKLTQDVRSEFNTLGINIPTHTDLGTRKKLEELLAHALSVDSLETISKLIAEEEYVLTVDFLLKMLNIHERRMCRYPVVIVGETGVGKTKLLEFLSKLWNKTIHKAYYRTLDSIVDIIAKQIDQMFNSQFQSENNPYESLFALNTAISSRTMPSSDCILKCCELLHKEFLKPLETFCRSSAFNLFNINETIATSAIKYPSPEHTCKFLTEILSAKPVDTFVKINVHSALTPAEIKFKFNEIIERAKQLSKRLIESDTPQDNTYQVPTLTVFLDEINTSHCLGLFKEIVIDGYIDGEELPDNVFIVAACNPHRSVTATLQQDTKIEDWVLGWYYVRKLHPTLSRILWDYGALNKNQEQEYIKQKFAVSALAGSLNVHELGHLSAQIATSQQLVRKFAENQLEKVGFDSVDAITRAKSCVSQRDIQRVFKITEFLDYINDENTPRNIQNSIIVAIGLVYYFRLDDTFRIQFRNEIDKLFGLTFSKTLNKYVDEFIKRVKIPPGIAETNALKENLFATLICTMSKIPLIIVGAPGTSKTLSFNLTISNVKGGESPREYFRNAKFPALEPHYYQCSRRSTSNEIENVFKIAIKRQETHDEANLKVFSVVFMDEAGLPEESHESMKVLHYYLDRPKVSFVAISNHILDAAKSNRAINIFRPQQQDDLYTLANGCFMKSTTTDTMHRGQQHFISKLCLPYEDLMKQPRFSKFYGLRDFIHMIGYLRRNRDRLNKPGFNKEELVLKAIERNFNGQNNVEFAEVANMFITKEVFVKHSRNIIEVLKESLEDTSIRPVSRKNRGGEEEEELVEVRYKMIIDPSEDDSLTRLLYHYNILNIRDTRMFIGSDFPGDGELQKVILISAIKHAAAEGKTVILSQADEIYENFYDLFNQNYKQVEDNKGRRYYANIAIGSHSKPCRVDPNFQCIVHIQKSFLDYAPQPFLNRFEKFHVSQRDLLDASLCALPPCMQILVTSTIHKVKEFIITVKQETFYGNILDSLESLLIDMLPKPGFNYDEVLKERSKQAYEPDNVESIDPGAAADENDEQEAGEYPPAHEYLDILLIQLKLLAGFNFIYLPTEERDQIAKDILQTAIYIDPMKEDIEVENLGKTIRANPQNIEQFIPGAIDHLMKENAPMSDEEAQNESVYLLPVDILPGQRLIIGMIVHFLVRYLCIRLLQLALPEALIVKYDQISETYKKTYLVHQNHFEFHKLIARYVALQDESRDNELTRPTKLLCYTRTTSFILSLPNCYPINKHMQSSSQEDVREMSLTPVIHTKVNTSLFKLSAIRTQEQFMSILRDYFQDATKRVLIFVADMQHVTQQRINFVRIMVDEEESVARAKVGTDFTLNKLIVILLHYPPTIFNRTLHKTRTGSFFRYPAHFLHGWDHCYLDNLQKQKENNPLNIQNWLSLTLLSYKDELKRIKEPMLESLKNKLPTLTVDILSRIKFGTNLNCIFNSNNLDLYQRAQLLAFLFRSEIGPMLCEMFISYWKSDFIREQIHNYANSIFQNLSNLSLTDLVVTSFWNLFTSFLTLMVYKMNENLNLEVLFDQFEVDIDLNQYPRQPQVQISLCKEETMHLFLGILSHLNLPTMEEVKNILHILDAQVMEAIHIPKFPFSTFVTRSFDNVIQSSIQDVNKNITSTQISKSSQGASKHNQEDLTKLLSENLMKNIQHYPLIQFILKNVGKGVWMDYLEDFAYDNISISSTDLFEKENNTSFLNLVRFWGNDFDPNDISSALLKLHISSFSNPPDFSKLLYIFSSLESLNESGLETLEEGMQSIMQQSCKAPSIFSYFISTLHQNISKILKTRPSSANIDNFKRWVRVYINLIIQFSGSAHSDVLEYTLTSDLKLKFAHIHSLYLIGKYYHLSDQFLINAFDLALFVKLQLKGAYDLKMIFHKGLEKIEDACNNIPGAKMGNKFKVQFAEGILHHHIEQNDKVDESIICWILRSANRQYVWSGTAARQTHAQAKTSVKEERIIEPGLLTFRFYQYIVTKFLSNEEEDKTEDTSINITQFNRSVKHLIATELFACSQVSEPTEYIPFYYDAGSRSFIKCSADVHPIMKQPLAHLYYQVALDRLTQLHGDKNLLTLYQTFYKFLDTNLSIDKDASYKVIARIEKQALFQVILQSYSQHFIHKPSGTVLKLIELHPECVKEIHSHVDDHNFGGGHLGGHSWSMLYLISNKFNSMEAFESYLEILNYSKDELPWVHKCVAQLKKIEKQTIPQFPFMNIRDKRYKSYKDCYDILRNIAFATELSDQERIIEELSQLVSKVAQHDKVGLCNLRMYFWLGIYQEFYLKGIYCEELFRAIKSNKFAPLALSEGKKRIILCFLNTETMIRTSETVESLNPDAPIYELKGNEVKMRQRTGEKKCFLFDFFSLDQKEHDAIVLRSILCNLIAVFIGLPDDTSHLSPFFLDPQSLQDTYIVSNLYPKPISAALKYDCGCELNEDGSYGRPDYYSFDRKSFTLHSFYLMTLMNFGAFTVSLVTQPKALNNLSGPIFSEWKQAGLYCLSQLRTIWWHMQLQWELTQEELGEFLTNCFYDFYLLALMPNSPLDPMVFKSTEEVEKYEFAIHTQVYEKNLKRAKEVRDVKAPHQPVISEFSTNVISFRKWYPTKITFLHLQHTIESCRPVDIKMESTVNNFAILHRFISERKRFRISSILIPNLLKFYRLFHTNLNYFITRKEAEEKTIDEVITDINKKCKTLLNVEIKELYERVLYFYRIYVKVCRGLIGFGPCAAIRREDKFMPLERNTKFIRLLSVTEEPEIGEDALYLVIQDLISTQNEFLQTVAETKKLLPWLSCYELETSTITPTEESTRNAFVSDLTPNETHHYWTSMKEIDENSLEIFELIRSRTTYTPFQNVDTCPYDLDALEQDIFWKYIASKPKFNTQTNLIHRVFKFKEIVVSNLPDPLNLQQFLTQMRNYLCEQSAQYLTELPYPIVQNLEYHFHTLDYGEFCRLLNALRQTLQRLAQGSIMMRGKEEELLQLSLEEFLLKQSPANDANKPVLKDAVFTEFSEQQTNILANDIKVNMLYSCMEFFLIKFNSRSYEYCKLPYCVKTPLPKDLSSQISNIGKELVESLRSKDKTKKELEQLLTTLQHCEQTFIQSPQTFVKATLLEFQFYDDNDKVIDLFPSTIQNAHYVALVGSLQSCIIDINRELAQRLEQRRTNTNEWKEQIVDFWSLLPHFWEVDTAVGENPDSSYDFSAVHNNPDLSFDFSQRASGEVYQSGGKEEESTEDKFTEGVDMGASYDFGFL